MTKTKISGRLIEKGILEKALCSAVPEFIAIYGRRRVGKTFLVREFFGDAICFEIVGVHNASLKVQLKNFSYALKDASGIDILPQIPGSWYEAFSILQQFIESLRRNQKRGKHIIFFDEIPWLNTPKSNFLGALEHFWNSFGSKHIDLILIICGSAASWMIQKIVNSKGGLHNRLTRQIRLLPFSLAETEDFLVSRGIHLSRFQIISLFMAIGGVPFYLMQAEPGFSTAQIIDKLCFSKEGLLRNEFDKLFTSLFDKSEHHIRIVEILKSKRSGMNRNQILSLAKIPSGGTASKILEELEESGFITSSVQFGKKSNDAIYRISDEFTIFYFDWIKPLGKRDPGQGFWLSRQNEPRKKVWAGYVFEGICQKHVPQIKNSLGIGGIETFYGPWYHFDQEKRPGKSAQIDLLIDRKDATMNLCEMKFSESEFTIDSDYAKKIKQKLKVLRSVTKTRKNVFITLITTYDVERNKHFFDIVSNSLTLDCLF